MKATIKIELRKDYATKEGKQMVCLRYTAYRRSTLISMNIAVYPKHWNKVSNTVRGSEPRCYYYNKAISEVYQKADTIVMENFFTPLPIPQFLERLKDKHHGNTDFYVFIENEIEQLKQSRAAGTISNYYKLINTAQFENLGELGLSGNLWLVSFKISYLCLPLFYETRTTPSCHPSGCAYRQL